MTEVKMRHIWQACCDLWPELARQDASDRSMTATAKRNAFATIAKHYGHSYSQIAGFIHRERSTIVYSVRAAEARKQRDAIYALSIHHICKEAQRIASGDNTPASIVAIERDPIADQELKGRTTMLEGSENLLRAIVREHPHIFAGGPVINKKFSPVHIEAGRYSAANKNDCGNIAA